MFVSRIFPTLLVVAGVSLLAGFAASTSRETPLPASSPEQIRSVQSAAKSIDAQLSSRWEERDITPASCADELTVLRRLSLALCGTVPSLEEIRRFEADGGPDRLERWTAAMLEDNRHINYFAERLARAYVGVEGGQFITFRRDRFTEWLRQQLREHRPYDAMVADMLTGSGVWTGEGEVNFVTAAFANEEIDHNKLTARTVRAFLGQRIDCAQCHDHPFDTWTQSQFEGLTAHFGQVDLTLMGIHDRQGYLFDLPLEAAGRLNEGTLDEPLRKTFDRHDAGLRTAVDVEILTDGKLWLIHDFPDGKPGESQPKYFVRRMADKLRVSGAGGEYIVEDRESLESRIVDPAVPFHPEWAGTDGSRRERLARWVTHPENRRFERAIANRVWGLMFGRPFLADRPVDDLPSPEQENDEARTRVLDLLGQDFREHGCDLRRLIQVIAATQAFRLQSRTDADSSQIAAMEENWALFPLVRLRPEQVIGSMLQASSVKTIDQNSHIFVRFLRLVREGDFVRAFGDPGENELQDRAGTIPQALLRMNGELARELSSENPFTAPARIARFSSTSEMVVENCFLACLSRRPTSAEREHFVAQLTRESQQRDGVVEDLFWTLYNAPEFSWNH